MRSSRGSGSPETVSSDEFHPRLTSPIEGRDLIEALKPSPSMGEGWVGVMPRHHRPCNIAPDHHLPVFGIEAQGSAGGSAPPACRSSIEILSGERTKAMRPSRGGRLMVTPWSSRRWQVA